MTKIIFGKIAYVKDHLNNILFYYLIIYPFQKQENYHIMIAGQIHKETFNDQRAAQQYYQHHFINTISQYKKSEVFEIGDKVFKWLSIGEMEEDFDIMSKNDDVIAFVKKRCC